MTSSAFIDTPKGKLRSGSKYTLTLRKGSSDADYSERTLTGEVRIGKQVDRVYDAEGIAVGTNETTYYEIASEDVTVGFLPKQVVSVEEA